MNEVKWIKLTTDMFDNRKIKHLRRLPEGNSIVLIWVMLLTMAGRCNAGGMIFLTENIPYTPKMLADELGFEENTVRLALDALEKLEMITVEGASLSISGWEEHQNVEGLEKIREQTRLRVAKHREKQAQLAECNATCNATVTHGNATDIDKDKEEDKDKEKDNITSSDEDVCPTAVGKKRTVFVPPSLEEVKAYCQERNNSVDAEQFIDFYTAKGWMIGKNKMKDWRGAVRTWERNRQGEKKGYSRFGTPSYKDDLEDFL